MTDQPREGTMAYLLICEGACSQPGDLVRVNQMREAAHTTKNTVSSIEPCDPPRYADLVRSLAVTRHSISAWQTAWHHRDLDGPFLCAKF